MTTLTLELQKQKQPVKDKLPEGWHYTEKYGEIFVSPGGIAWVVKEMPNHELKSVPVPAKPEDIIKTPATDRVKHAAAERKRYQARLTVRKASNFGTGKAEGGKQGVLEVLKQ